MSREEKIEVQDSGSAFDDESYRDLYMTFRLDRQTYGLEILKVMEIVGMQAITEVPDVPPYVKGVMNLRGNVIPVTDIRRRFAMEPRAYDDRTCVMVIKVKDTQVGMLVDSVREVMSIRGDRISPPPALSENSGETAFIQGMGRLEDEVVIILDVERLLFEQHQCA